MVEGGAEFTTINFSRTMNDVTLEIQTLPRNVASVTQRAIKLMFRSRYVYHFTHTMNSNFQGNPTQGIYHIVFRLIA